MAVMTTKIVFMMIAMITMALTLVLTTTTNNLINLGGENDKRNSIFKTTARKGSIISKEHVKDDMDDHKEAMEIVAPKRGIIRSRFLVENINSNRNPRAADHCNKDNEICYVLEGQNSTCCNNKCMDLSMDSKNCGACKNKCKFTESCCGGQCVNLAYDKRHCGVCNNKCMHGGYCLYGMCDYA